GVSISTKDIKRFSDEINKVARKNLKEIELIPKLKIDLEVDFKFLDWNLLDEISKFAPTGPGNPNPLFLTKDVVVWKIRTIGAESRHLKMRVEKDNVTFDAIGFGLGWRASELTEGISGNIAYYFEENI